jgi:hypothetical protein
MPYLHLGVEPPEDASPDEIKALRAKAIATALGMASSDPAFRLRMILGEAYQQFQEIARWAAAEIGKDEAKAPGLTEMARRFANDLSGALFEKTTPQEVVAAQQQILSAAVRQLPAPLLLEHDEKP